ncbi:MAG: hypothetical protein KC731_10785 [Myxococcales bacterium]|nr:hypothetical protein [Myxococcales bacterium]
MSGPAVDFPSDAPELAADLATLRELPASAKEDLWALLAPNLGQDVGDGAQRAAARFAAEHGVELARLIPLVRGCRRLFRSAAERDLGVEAVHEGVAKLTGDPEIARRLSSLYLQAAGAIRGEAIVRSLERFGPVLEDVGLRMDHVSTSRHQPNKMVPIAMLSLRYRDGDEDKRLTLQVPPTMLKQLQSLLGSVVR